MFHKSPAQWKLLWCAAEIGSTEVLTAFKTSRLVQEFLEKKLFMTKTRHDQISVNAGLFQAFGPNASGHLFNNTGRRDICH